MRINCHSHVFTLRSVLTSDSRDMVQRRLREEVDPPWLGKAVAGIADDVLAGLAAWDKEALLRKLLARLEKESGYQQALKNADVPSWLRPVLERQVDRWALPLLRRGFAALLRALRPSSDDEDITKKNLGNAFDTLRLITRPRIAELAEGMFAEIGATDGAVLLGLDLTYGDNDAGLFAAQMDDTAALIYRFPGRALPFYGIDPRRSDPLGRARRAILRDGFVGIKIYPSSGWKVTSSPMKDILRFCAEEGVPILKHCNDGGFYGKTADTANADPRQWRALLEDHDGLKVCFGHFGGGSGLSQAAKDAAGDITLRPNHWANEILALARDFPGVYADLSAHSYPMKSAADRKTYFDNLKLLLDHSVYGERILFGTDFWLMRIRTDEGRHWRFFEEGLGEEYFRRIAEENPRRYLGLPGEDGGGASAAMRTYADRIAAVPDDSALRLEEMPAPWLLALIERLKGPARRAQVEASVELAEPSPNLRLPDWRQHLNEMLVENLKQKKVISLLGADDKRKPLRMDFKGTTLGLAGDASFAVQRFWDADHLADEDGVIAKEGAVPKEEMELGPAISFDASSQWLKYRLFGALRLDGEGDLGSVGLHLDVAKEVVLADYRRHPSNEPLDAILREDLLHPRFALRLRDVRALRPGEALSWSLRGKLAAEASISWGTALSSNLGALAEAVELTDLPAVTVKVGATVSAGITIHDDFRVVFSRHEGNAARPFRVAVSKLDSRGVDFEIAVSTELQWSDPDAVETLLQELLAKKLGRSLARAERLLDKGDQLSDAEKAVVDEILGRLGVDGVDGARAKLEELKKRTADAIRRIAEGRLRAGFRFEYHRLKTSRTLLEAHLTEDALSELHDLLVDGEIGGVLDRAGTDDVDIARYLVEQRTRTEQAWGFNLGSRIVGQDWQEREIVVQRALVQGEWRLKVSFQGARGYKGKWPIGLDSWKWQGDFKAEMSEFSGTPQPTTADFEYGIAFLFEWEDSRFKKDLLSVFLDMAVLWGALPAAPASYGPLDAEIRSLIQGKKGSLRLELVVPHEVLRRVIPLMAVPDASRMGRALGAAMPWKDDVARRTVTTRRELYGPVWRDVLEDIAEQGSGWALDQRIGVYTGWANSALHQVSASAAREERNWRVGAAVLQHTLGGRLFLDAAPAVHRNWQTMLAGLSHLDRALRKLESSHYETVRDDIYDQLKPSWKQTHGVRTMGALFLDAASEAGMLANLGGSLAVTHPANGGTQTRLYARP